MIPQPSTVYERPGSRKSIPVSYARRKFANVFPDEPPDVEAVLVPSLLLFLLEPQAAASRTNPAASARTLRSHVRVWFALTSSYLPLDPLGFVTPIEPRLRDVTGVRSRAPRFFRRTFPLQVRG